MPEAHRGGAFAGTGAVKGLVLNAVEEQHQAQVAPTQRGSDCMRGGFGKLHMVRLFVVVGTVAVPSFLAVPTSSAERAPPGNTVQRRLPEEVAGAAPRSSQTLLALSSHMPTNPTTTPTRRTAGHAPRCGVPRASSSALRQASATPRTVSASVPYLSSFSRGLGERIQSEIWVGCIVSCTTSSNRSRNCST